MHLARSTLLGLAPDRFKNERRQRYGGDDQAVPLGAFTDEEQTTFRGLYSFLRDLELAATTIDGLDTFLQRASIEAIAMRTRAIGFGRDLAPDVAAAAHDLRSGMLSALFLELLFEPSQRISLEEVRALTRDCAKLMRNLLAEIDPHGREADLNPRSHSIIDLAAAFRAYRGSKDKARVTLTMFADDRTAIASSCAEFGAIERVIFILLDNAGRHAGDAEIEVVLVALEADLRIVVTNVLDGAARAKVDALLALDPAKLYSQFSSTGSGLGLQTVADLVGRAYGIRSTKELVGRGYVGTQITSDVFASWFHWPLASSADGSCDCADA